MPNIEDLHSIPSWRQCMVVLLLTVIEVVVVVAAAAPVFTVTVCMASTPVACINLSHPSPRQLYRRPRQRLPLDWGVSVVAVATL